VRRRDLSTDDEPDSSTHIKIVLGVLTQDETLRVADCKSRNKMIVQMTEQTHYFFYFNGQMRLIEAEKIWWPLLNSEDGQSARRT
jgi:hypothetical protein